MKPDKTEAQKQIEQARRDSLRDEFLTRWKQLGGPELEEKFKFHLVRKWEIDFYHQASRIGIEIEGGTWLPEGGRHNRAQGYSDDCEKYNAAQIMGIKVLRFTSDMLAADPAGHLSPVIGLIRETKTTQGAGSERTVTEEKCIHCWHYKARDSLICCHCALEVSYQDYHSQRMNHGPHKPKEQQEKPQEGAEVRG